MSRGSVTSLLYDIGQSEDPVKRTDAETKLLKRYFDDLLRHARRKLGGVSRRVADEEDVALQAMQNLFEGIRDDRFRKLDDRDDLWQVLLMLTARRASNQRRAALAEKHGAGSGRGESAFASGSKEGEMRGIEQVVGDAPTPELVAEFLDTLRGLLELSPEPEARSVIEMKLAGHTHEQIAEKLGLNSRTIDRRLVQLRARCRQLA